MEIIPGLPNDLSMECLIRVAYFQFPTLRIVSKLWKEKLASPEFQNRRNSAGFAQTILALSVSEPGKAFGEVKYRSKPTYKLVLYDPLTDGWLRLPPVPCFPLRLPLFCQLVTAGKYLILLGGWDPITWDVSHGVFLYDVYTGKWHRGNDIPGQTRSFFACASDSDNIVMVSGGHDENNNALKSSLLYNVDEDEWVNLPDMKKARDEAKAIFRKGKFVVIGGFSTDSELVFETTSETFDAPSGRWKQPEEFLEEITLCRTLISGDGDEICRFQKGKVHVLKGKAWTEVAELPSTVGVSPYAVAWKGKLLVVGAAGQGGPYSAYRFDNNRWKRVTGSHEFIQHVQAGCSLRI